MKPRIAFLVKNGIGYGHLRRALLLAEALRGTGAARPVIVSQAHTVDLFGATTVPVVNFPLIQHLPSDTAADWYTDVLDELLDRLDPTVVVEDTYPDTRYLALPALRHRTRVLVLRRLDGLSFDTIRITGRLAAYDRILLAQDPAAFALEGHSGQTRTAVELSGRFAFVGQLYRRPDPEAVERIRQRQQRRGRRLVVVNGGAGGDQLADGYGDRLFHAAATVADRLAPAQDADFVLVTGPYYAGRPVPDRDNITVLGFTPELPELLAAADVAVIKPGHNGLSEALCGGARLVLVPDASFLEGLDEHSRRVTDRYGGTVTTPDADVLEPAVRAALAAPPRTERLDGCDAAINRVVAELLAATEPAQVTIPPQPLLLALRPPAGTAPPALRTLLPDALRDALVVGANLPRLSDIETGRTTRTAGAGSRPTGPGLAVLVDTAPGAADPGPLVASGVRLVIGAVGDTAFERWRQLPVPGPALLIAHASTVVADPARPERLHRHLRDAATQHRLPAVLLDLCELDTSEQLQDYLTALSGWLADQPLRPLPVDQAAALLAANLLEAK